MIKKRVNAKNNILSTRKEKIVFQIVSRGQGHGWNDLNQSTFVGGYVFLYCKLVPIVQ